MKSASQLVSKKAWQIVALLLALSAGTAAAQPKAPSAERVLADAQAHAVAEHKTIFLTFQASWCEPCRQLESFLCQPGMNAIFEKYFVFAALHIAEEGGQHPELQSPGAEVLLLKWGGVSGEAVAIPYIVMLNEKAQPIINSNRPVHGKQGSESIGYPASQQEIYWFLVMLKKSAPAMTEEEGRTIAARLKELAEDQADSARN
jgi:thiol-disulfide isomerase/thioredoxin